MFKAVIFDYGCVISTEQVKHEIEAMVDLIKISEDTFKSYYYQYRLEYDRGISGEEYWNKVLSACKVDYDQELIVKLINHDLKSWTVTNQAMLDWAEGLKKNGYKLGIISNMPKDILKYMRENFSWLKNKLFDTVIFSCDLRICKPDPLIYRQCLDNLDLSPVECLFIDDSEINIQAAKEIGLNVFHYRGLEDLTTLQAMFVK